MIKSSLRHVSTLQLKIFLSSQVNFLHMCEPNLTNIHHIDIIFQWIHKLFYDELIIRWTREEGNQAQGRKKDIGRFKLSLDRGINSAHEFYCTRNAFGVHVTCTATTVHAICIDLKTPDWRQWRRSGVFNVNFEHISHPLLMFLLLPLNM